MSAVQQPDLIILFLRCMPLSFGWEQSKFNVVPRENRWKGEGVAIRLSGGESRPNISLGGPLGEIDEHVRSARFRSCGE